MTVGGKRTFPSRLLLRGGQSPPPQFQKHLSRSTTLREGKQKLNHSLFHLSKEEMLTRLKSGYVNLSALLYGKKGEEPSVAGGSEWYSARVSFWMKRYEDFVGLTDVKTSQVRVVQTEKAFVKAQDDRRDTQRMVNEVQQKIKNLHSEIERTYRGEDRYLELVTLEHHYLKEEKTLADTLALREREEREGFSKLSRVVRDSHESERAQAEKTKYWSVIGSVVGTCLGILGTTVNNRLRMRELRQLVQDSSSSTSSPDDGDGVRLRELFDKVNAIDQASNRHLAAISKSVAVLSAASLTTGTAKSIGEGELRQLLEKQHRQLEKKVDEVKGTTLRNLTEIRSKVEDVTGRSKLDASKACETLNRNAATAMESFEKRVFDIEEKLRDVRSLLLSQVLSDEKKLVAASFTSASATELDRSRTVVGSMEVALKQHEQRLTARMVVHTLIVAVIAPVVGYVVVKGFSSS